MVMVFGLIARLWICGATRPIFHGPTVPFDSVKVRVSNLEVVWETTVLLPLVFGLVHPNKPRTRVVRDIEE
jgi:hypothetical protein